LAHLEEIETCKITELQLKKPGIFETFLKNQKTISHPLNFRFYYRHFDRM